jgi:hypothetical protein
METKLKSITTQYRSFVDNQVLTADQLNNLIQYFDDQDRLSRVSLSGVGIACGFKISLSGSKEVVVTQGCGITTDGDLIKLQKPGADENSRDVEFQSIKYTHYKVFEDSVVKYQPFFNGVNQVPLYELVPETTQPKEDEFSLNTLPGLENMVALLYLEAFPKPPELCTAIDCDNQGVVEVSRLKVLLCSETSAGYINSSDPIYTKHAVRQAYLLLPDLAVPRVLLTNFGALNQPNLLKSFHNAISDNNLRQHLKTAVTILFTNFSGFLKLPVTINDIKINQLIDQLLGFSASAIPADVQYRYDLLNDLVETFKEIKELLLQLDAECSPNINSFPKHLMLGKFSVSVTGNTFRHTFCKSPVVGVESQNIACLNSLITRFYLMLSDYSISGNEVKITPSKMMVSLSNRSIPYYFKVDEPLIENWDFSKTTRLAQKTNLCYFTGNLSTADHVRNPLKYKLDAFDFFRIEGHLGKASGEVSTRLNSLIASYGPDLKFLIYDIDKEQNDLQYFINQNNSIEHMAGVPKGGTFVLVKKADTIIADFALGYKLMAGETEQCCKIEECSYPWISSLKYLNNLSRSLKGTQSRRVPMPKNYRLLIGQYSINGISLIGQSVELAIPLADVFRRRMHVVVEKLNEKFPTGLVFDFDQQNKQFKIKKLKDDSFVFSVKDITLSNNSPVYTYTDKSFMRNSRMFRAKDISCTVVNMHLKGFYQQMHSKFNPVNKDDDYGRYNDKWSKWYDLVNRLVTNPFFRGNGQRFATKVSGLPKEIQTDLGRIKTEIVGMNRNATAMLSGEWADGTWVDDRMLDYFDAKVNPADVNSNKLNRNNTHDDIVLFIRLREKLHQKKGKSTFAIFVSGLTDAQLKSLQTTFATTAHFYSGRVEGESFIVL